MKSFPQIRLRRLRESASLRKLTQEVRLSINDFVYPLFVTHGRNVRREIEPMPGIYHFSLDTLTSEIREIGELGIPAILLFGLPDKKDDAGTEAYKPNGIVQEAIRIIKETTPELLIITDVCLCEYTEHGHCGILSNGTVNNDLSLALLSQTALSHVEAGADVVAPSAMMDGQVKAIRTVLDNHDRENIPIMSYSAKYASSFYGPFRVAANSTPKMGDRYGYQIDPAQLSQSLREIEQDIGEGADIVMVKPALAYLDVVAAAKRRFDHPIAAYNVSGEYTMVKAGDDKGWIDGNRITIEILTAIKRAGADIIITYHAKEIAQWGLNDS